MNHQANSWILGQPNEWDMTARQRAIEKKITEEARVMRTPIYEEVLFSTLAKEMENS